MKALSSQLSAVSHCRFQSLTAGTPCANGCGYRLRRDSAVDVVRPCGRPAPRRFRLGTFVARCLAAVWIRKRPDCNCDAREERLNEWGWRIVDWLNPPGQ